MPVRKKVGLSAIRNKGRLSSINYTCMIAMYFIFSILSDHIISMVFKYKSQVEIGNFLDTTIILLTVRKSLFLPHKRTHTGQFKITQTLPTKTWPLKIFATPTQPPAPAPSFLLAGQWSGFHDISKRGLEGTMPSSMPTSFIGPPLIVLIRFGPQHLCLVPLC